MSQNPNYRTFAPQNRPALEPDELDDATLDEVVGGLATSSNSQEAQKSYNLQYLQSQSQMQAENRSYTAVSNIMKTKHDTVKTSIGNIR